MSIPDPSAPPAPLTAAEIARAAARCIDKLDANLARFGAAFPAPASVAGRYPLIGNNDWTNGFWPGMLWLAFELTGEARFRDAGLRHVAGFEDRIRNRRHTNHHDLGFLYSLSCVAAHRLTGEPRARAAALLAADCLAERFRPKGRFIQAWGDLDDPASYRLIVDCLMNLPLLFWAAEEARRPELREVAIAHLDTTLRHLVRDDDSTVHTFFFDPATGEPSRAETHQGHGAHSCWARGQAWAMYGLALALRFSDRPDTPSAFRRVTRYFLDRLPADHVCHWDLVFVDGPEERDSSAAAIAVCGLLEAAPRPGFVPERTRYLDAAHLILRSLMTDYAATPAEDGLLLHAVYSKPHRSGVDECCIWGDYFFLESLVRLTRDWKPYW